MAPQGVGLDGARGSRLSWRLIGMSRDALTPSMSGRRIAPRSLEAGEEVGSGVARLAICTEDPMRPVLLIAVVLLSLVACSSAASQNLDGRWAWEANLNPSGSYMTLSLTTADNNVTGTGRSIGVGPRGVVDSITITGRRSRSLGSLTFRLTFNFARGRVGTYSGQLVGPNQLQGTWTEADQSHTVIFYREGTARSHYQRP